MRALVVGTALLLAAPGAAMAADWQVVDMTDDETVYVDAGSIGYYEDGIRAWVKMNWNKPQKDPQGHVFQSSRQRVAVRCEGKQMALLGVTNFAKPDFSGGIGMSFDLDLPEWKDVAPDTVGLSMVEFVCSHLPPK